ncbi:MAG: hypothetical protein PF517_03975 [Salinivirgaceae bacterium]|nr:hypothetical protein [Salinivirgaceae bacterium]
MKRKLVFIMGIVLFQISFIACVNDTKKDKTQTNLIEFEDEAQEVDEKIFYRFPSPDEIFKFIKSSDLQYNGGSLNPPMIFNKYAGIKNQALNLGIYISDLAYITMFEQHEASLEYFMAIHGLSEELKISAAFDEPLVTRISENIGNADSLVVIASDAYTKIVDYLVEHEQEDILALVSAGALVESLNLIVDYVDSYSDDNTLIKKLLDQKYVVNNLTQYVKQNNKEIIDDVEKLNVLFSNLESVDTETTVEKTKSNKLVIGGGSELSISPENFEKLKETIQSLRAKYIKIE